MSNPEKESVFAMLKEENLSLQTTSFDGRFQVKQFVSWTEKNNSCRIVWHSSSTRQLIGSPTSQRLKWLSCCRLLTKIDQQAEARCFLKVQRKTKNSSITDINNFNNSNKDSSILCFLVCIYAIPYVCSSSEFRWIYSHKDLKGSNLVWNSFFWHQVSLTKLGAPRLAFES